MKKLFAVVFIVLFFIVGCDTVYKPPVTPVCLKPEYSNSVICAIGTYLKIQPEQMHEIIIDTTLLGIGFKLTNGPEVRKTVDKIRTFVQEKDVLSMQGLVGYLMKEAELNPAFALLLQRRLPDFAGVPELSVKPFQPIDKFMVLWELDQLDEYLKWM
jgi:hypothetical protein